jgi:hypothetical protein
MYVCIRVGHKSSPCTATFNDLYIFLLNVRLSLDYTALYLRRPHCGHLKSNKVYINLFDFDCEYQCIG